VPRFSDRGVQITIISKRANQKIVRELRTGGTGNEEKPQDGETKMLPKQTTDSESSRSRHSKQR